MKCFLPKYGFVIIKSVEPIATKSFILRFAGPGFPPDEEAGHFIAPNSFILANRRHKLFYSKKNKKYPILES